MNEPVIQANESLVRNGYFNDRLDGWTRKGQVGLATEMYEGVYTNYMDVGGGSLATQAFTIPKKPDANARYELTFLCELNTGLSWAGDPGWLRILKGNDVLMSIELQKGDSRNLEQDQARLAAGQPLVFNPIAYRASLDALAFDRGDELSVQVSGVANSSDQRTSVRITHINLQLHLEPLRLQEMRLDDQTLAPGATLHLCLGTTILGVPHRLTFLPEPGNAWENTEASLSSVGNPREAIIATPDWGVDQSLESEWLLDCPWVGDEERYEFALTLRNRYAAEPFTIPISLGHHRLAFRDEQQASHYPVLEYEDQGVWLGVRVVSYYTSQAIADQTVNWSVAGQGVKAASVTNEQGWAEFYYQPQVAGDVVVTATVASLYYAEGEVSMPFEVKVLATDPWNDLKEIVDGAPTDWDTPGYPNRGSAHELQVRLPADSPLLNTTLALRWSGDGHEQLGVVVEPPVGRPVPVETPDMGWTLTCEDRLDGRFKLSLVCSMLKLPAPEKIMSLARNKVRIADVREANKYPVVADQEMVVLRLQVVHVTTRGDGEGVIDARVDWDTLDGPFSTRTGTGGWASLPFVPRQVGEQVVTASVKAYEGAVGIEQKFDVKAIATSAWKDKVAIKVDNLPIERIKGAVCYRGETHTLQVEALPGSPLIGQDITLEWRGSEPGIGLVASDIGTPKTLPAEGGLSWTLESDLAGSTSSMFEMRLTCAGLEDRELFGRLMKRDFQDELSVVLDQMTTTRGQQLYPCLGARHRYTLRPHALSPLVGLNIAPLWVSGDTPDKLGITIEPALITEQWLEDGGATWTLDCSSAPAPADFSLLFQTPLGRVDANQMKMGHNKVRIEASHESAVDPVVGQDPAWMWAQVVSHFTDLAVDQVPVKWTVDEQPQEHKTAADGWSGFPFVPATGGGKTVEARVISPYDGFEESRSMTVNALASDPWEEVVVSFDGQAEQSLGTQAFFPRRNGEHRLDVKAPQDSALFGKYLTLGMMGTGPAALGVRFEEPRLGEPRYFSEAGLTYLFRVGDLKDGSFGLGFSSSRLARLSPVNAFSVGQGAQVVKIAERQRINKTLLWREVVSEQITVISVISGKPMVGVTVTWRSPDLGVVTSTTNFYGVAKIDFVPTTPGAFALTATVGDELYSDSVSMAYFLSEPRQITALVIDEPGGYPGQHMTAQAWVVSANTGEPMADVEVMWEYDNASIPATMTDADGKATCSFTFGSSGEAALWASVQGGLAGWDVKTLWLTVYEPPAAVASVVASLNPVPLQTYVTMTALIVDKESREPMPKRKIQVSNNGAPFFETTTDSKGQYQSYWRPMSITDNVSLAVKLNNPDGTSDSGAVYVTVVS
ncbi:hypothetical protein IAI51_08760 [Pseudomonas sp. N40(2020)]|uniref:hypothetical protein n=1 Tax=Pseudomonas sp. N40(2020) TaxID=2767798 RepID=UPI0016572016|nr:hypothetical protein [Pseudomonas sp. N40(2020)]MBC8996613.1 hypothetical protein [Pseudomonas sp. N40(2020)]